MNAQGEKTRQAILGFVAEFCAHHGYSPSYSEIMDATGIASTQTVSHHLHILRKAGDLTWDDGRPRTLRLRGAA